MHAREAALGGLTRPGQLVQIAKGPSAALVETCELAVVNVSRAADKSDLGGKTCCGVPVADSTAVGDKLVFFSHAERAVDVVWWA